MLRLAIIGTAGRGGYESRTLSIEHIEFMINKVNRYIRRTMKTDKSNVILVSGGSAWADHIAVLLYNTNKFGGLELYLPAKFSLRKKRFNDTYEGNRLNGLHTNYWIKIGENSPFDDLVEAITNSNTKVIVKKGFKERNTLISKNNDYLIAFTFNSDNNEPKEGGTKDTWDKTNHENKKHYSLS